MLIHKSYCPFHGEVDFLDLHTCKECKREREQKEEDRWNSLSLERKIEELKERLDRIENKSTILG